MPVDIQRLIHLGKSEGSTFPFEGVRGIGCRLGVLLFLEGGIPGTSFKEVDEGSIQMAKGHLQGNRGNILEPGMFPLEVGEHGSKGIVVELLTTFLVGSGTGIQAPIVDEAGTSEGVCKDDPLLIGRIEPKVIRALRLAHGLLAFLVLNIPFDGIKGDASSGATVIAVRPQRGQLPFQMGKLQAQLTTAGSFDELHQPMDTELWVTPNEQVDVIGHDFHFNERLSPLLYHLLDEGFQAGINPVDEDLTPILGAKDDMIMTSIGNISVACNYCIHAESLPQGSSFVKGSYVLQQCARFIPMSGMSGGFARDRS
jgi:hypothetical protein